MARDETPPDLLTTLRWRCIGPSRGGRVVAVAGHPTEPSVFYFGACAGGVWKTSDGGTYWENVSDGYFNTAAVGAIAVADSDPNVVYAGTGESCIRGNVSNGDGVYRSTDGGETWTHVGLEDTRHISRIRVHPNDPDLVYVAALGHAFGPNEQRGVFRSRDGGGSWERVLYRSERAGAIDLSMDARNPRILYASIWQALREPWMFTSGGPDSGLFRSTDGGDTWADITDSAGLPAGLKGRMGVSASPARDGRVWALVEAEDRGLYRSDDGGRSWERISDDPSLLQRPWYYSHVFADPADPDTVYVLNLKTWRSTDGGRTFTEIAMPHGDNHDLWIDPRNPARMIEGNDGGACVSFNAGESWSTIHNQLTSQFYHVTTDGQSPYRVYGTQQDNSAISVPSRTVGSGIPWGACYEVGPSESGHIAVHPDDPNIVYSGAVGSAPGGGDTLLRYDHRTGRHRIVSVWPESNLGWGAMKSRYRFQWTYPVLFSPHDPRTLYAAGNRVFRTVDEGVSWEAISPDLTRADEAKMEASGGPITLDTSGVEVYGTIFAMAESPHERGVFWVGTDDGLVHTSRDDGETWESATPDDLPEWTLICNIEPSRHDRSAAYLAATRYRLHDNRPYLYKTFDLGRTWRTITDGIPGHEFTRVIREDPVRRGLLYAGTESGVYVSFDDGERWRRLRGNLPVVPVHDLVVKGDELVAATHGRAFWILDDLTLLRQIAEADGNAPPTLFRPADAIRRSSSGVPSLEPALGKRYLSGATYRERRLRSGETLREHLDAGDNPPHGVVVSYHLRSKPEGVVRLEFHDSKGRPVRDFSSSEASGSGSPHGSVETPALPADAGMNRFVWDMRYPGSHRIEGEKPSDGDSIRPLAPPGSYTVRLSVDGRTQTQSFELLTEPSVQAKQAQLDEQFALLTTIRDKLSASRDGVSRSRRVRSQVDEWVSRARAEGVHEALAEVAEGLRDGLSALEKELVNAGVKHAVDWLNLPERLDTRLLALAAVVASSDDAPTRQSYEVFERLSERVDVQIRALDEAIETDLPTFTRLVASLNIPAISTGAPE